MTNEEKYKTPEERSVKFDEFCKHSLGCKFCRTKEYSRDVKIKCYFTWLALEAEEKKPIPCPCCGAEVHTVHVERLVECCGYKVVCERCGLQTGLEETPDGAVALWNRRTNNG